MYQPSAKTVDLRFAYIDMATADLPVAHRQKLESTDATGRMLVTNPIKKLGNGGWRQEFMGEVFRLHTEYMVNSEPLMICSPVNLSPSGMVYMANLNRCVCHYSTVKTTASQKK